MFEIIEMSSTDDDKEGQLDISDHDEFNDNDDEIQCAVTVLIELPKP